MKLTWQGILVIFCPLAFQLLLIGALFVVLNQAQAEVDRNIRSELIVNDCNLIVRELTKDVSTFFENMVSPVGRGSINELAGSFQSQVKDLHRILAGDPIQAASDKQLMEEAQHFDEMVAKLHKHSLNSSEIISVLLSGKLMKVVDAIANAERTKMQDRSAVKERQRTTTRLVLLGFALFGIGISASVAVLWSMRLRKLIAMMTENASRFSRREPLAQMLSGTDEVARVDQVFHAMDSAIDDALVRARALIDNAADLVCSVDRNGFFERANRFSRRLIGYEPSQLVGKSVIDLVISEDCSFADEQINKSFVTEAGNLFELRLKGIEERIVETSWSTFWSEADGSLFCVVGDITEHKNIERLKQDFIAMISHDLRSPLMSVASSISLVQSGAMGAVAEGVERNLQGMEKTIDRLIGMINDLLDFEKLEAGKMQFALKSVAMDAVISEAFREVLALTEPNNVTLAGEHNSLCVRGDKEKLIQLLINLLANAIRYSPPSGVVSVRCLERDGKVEVAVLDDGPGVPKEFQETVFAPFENAPGSKQTNEGGTGLGLAICKLIVEGHEGEIGVRNRDVGGAEFWFTLSAASQRDEQASDPV